jgi:hypothetical protein
MAKPLNFSKVKKSYLPVTFADENETTIFVGTPTKAIMEDLKLLQNLEDGSAEAGIDELFGACAKIMSRNKTGAKITREFLETVFDYEDIVIFFRSYMEFVSEIISSKN